MVNWKIISLLIVSGDMITRTFIAFFIWERAHDLQLILLYALLYFGVMPLASLISGVLADQVDSKISLLVGVWFQIIQITLIIMPDFSITRESIILIALIGGFAEGFRNIAIHSIEFKIRDASNLAGFYANKNLLIRLFQLIIPLSAAFLISYTDGFNQLFQVLLGVLILKSILIVIFRLPNAPNKFDVKQIMTIPGTNPDKGVLIKGMFFEGLSDGITLTILPIIVLVFAESILNWGFINTALVIFSILVSFIITKFINDLNSKVLYSIGAFVFASISIIFITQYSFLVILVFLLAHNLMDIIKEIGYHSSIERIMEEDRKEYELYAEYQFLNDFVTNIGRIIPIIALVYLGFNIENETLVRATLVLVGILPLIALSVLGQSRIFRDEKVETLGSIRHELLPTLDHESQDIENTTQTDSPRS